METKGDDRAFHVLERMVRDADPPADSETGGELSATSPWPKIRAELFSLSATSGSGGAGCEPPSSREPQREARRCRNFRGYRNVGGDRQHAPNPPSAGDSTAARAQSSERRRLVCLCSTYQFSHRQHTHLLGFTQPSSALAPGIRVTCFRPARSISPSMTQSGKPEAEATGSNCSVPSS